jgi:hypothetical protein
VHAQLVTEYICRIRQFGGYLGNLHLSAISATRGKTLAQPEMGRQY